jgi:hypothetical protein
MRKNKYLYLLLLLLVFGPAASAQSNPPFWDEVQAIKAYDKVYQQQPQPIVFVGSSSIRKWEHLQVAFGNTMSLTEALAELILTILYATWTISYLPITRGKLYYTWAKTI